MSTINSITVHLRVSDAATGQPTPVRLRFAGPNGEYFAPLGRVAEFSVGHNEDVGGNIYLGGKRHTYIDGSCEIRLPIGVPLDLEILKGPEYVPIRKTIMVGPGHLTLRFAVERFTSRPTQRWMSADTRCHFLSPHTALLEAAAEDLDFIHLLASEQDIAGQDGHLYRTIPNMTAFSGQQAALERNGHAVVVNTLNTHPALGSLALLNCHRTVFPLSFGGDATDDWSLCDWADQCHRKKGLVVWCDAYRSEAGLAGGEALVAAILGKIDAIELDARERQQPFLPHWYRLLNAGVRLPLVGASAKESNRVAIGSMRTYTTMSGESRNLADWVERTREGHTFVSNSPLLELDVKNDAGNKLAIRASAKSLLPYDNLEIVVNGEVIAASGPGSRLEIEYALPQGGWVAARCRGSAKSALDGQSPLFAHTSPVYSAASTPTPATASAIQSLRRQVEDVPHWVETVGRFEQPRGKPHLLERCDDALRILAQRLPGT